MNKEQFFTSIQGKTVTFCGIGRSHMPLIRLFQEKGALVSARDKRSLEELGDNGKALQERGAAVTSEMEVFFQLCPCKIYAVTGSDGKPPPPPSSPSC